MANPYKDREKHKKVAPGGVKTEESVVLDDIVDNATENILENVVETTPSVSFLETVASKIEKKPEGKSVSLYLTTDALANLEKFAKENKCSKSKAADLILRSLY